MIRCLLAWCSGTGLKSSTWRTEKTHRFKGKLAYMVRFCLCSAHMWYMDIHSGKTPIYITIKWKTKPKTLWAFVEREEGDSLLSTGPQSWGFLGKQ